MSRSAYHVAYGGLTVGSRQSRSWHIVLFHTLGRVTTLAERPHDDQVYRLEAGTGCFICSSLIGMPRLSG